jgi:hypothetical protein
VSKASPLLFAQYPVPHLAAASTARARMLGFVKKLIVGYAGGRDPAPRQEARICRFVKNFMEHRQHGLKKR